MNHRSRTVLVEDIPVRVRKSRTRSLRLTIHVGGEVRLTLPYFVSYKKGLAFLREKQSWITQKQKELGRVPVPFLRQGSQEDFRGKHSQALGMITGCLKKFQDVYGMKPKKIAVRDQKTRWGSCSRAGTLSFNYRLILLPERLRDYVIVHELCHLEEFNHSRNFWSLVGRVFPDYKDLCRELRHFQASGGGG